MITERVNIVINSKGDRVVIRKFRRIGQSARTAGRGVFSLQSAIAALGGGFVVRQLQRTADTFTRISNRLRVVTNSQEDFNAANSRLFQLAQETRSPLENLVQTYSRFAVATNDLGLGQRTLLSLVENVQKAAIAGGATAQEARASIIQFSQALGEGRLRGQELRSVLQQLPLVGQRIAKELGVNVGALRRLGEEGSITRQVLLDALGDVDEEIRTKFDRTRVTLQGGITRVKNAFLQTIGQFDEATGATEKLTGALTGLAENFDLVLIGLTVITSSAIISGVAKLAAGLFTIAGLKFVGILGALAAVFVGVTKLRNPSNSLIENFKELGTSIDELFNERARKVLQQARRDQEVLVNAIRSGDNALAQRNAEISKEIKRLQSSNLTLEKRLRLESDLAARLKETQGLSAGAFPEQERKSNKFLNEKLANLQRENRILREQTTIVNDLQEATDRFEIRQEALKRALDAGQITAKQYSNEISKLKRNLDPAAATQLELNEVLKQANNITTQVEAAILGARVEVQRRKNEEESLKRALDRTNISTEERIILEERLKDVQDKDTSFQLPRNLAPPSGVGISDSPLARFQADLTNFADQSETIIVNAFNSAEQAFVDFTKTGRLEFSTLVDSVLADVSRLLFRQGLTQLLSLFGGGLFGGGGGPTPFLGAGLPFAGARQGGGPVEPNKAFLVGEKGPELFVPPSTGQIVPNGQGVGPNITIVNVTDSSMVEAFLASAEGEQVIINTLASNKDAVKRALG